MRSPERAWARARRPGADAAVDGHGGGGHGLDERGALPVPELADVEVALDAVEAPSVVPAQEDVAARLHEVLAVHHPFAVGAVVGCARRTPRAPTACASLACRNSGSASSRPNISTIHARVPTLPTPTTLRATSDQAEVLEQVAAVALQRRR